MSTRTEPLDFSALSLVLAEVVDVRGPLRATLISGGKSNLTYVITDGDRRWILRRPPLGDILPSAHDMGREYRVMTALRGSPVPVPRTWVLCRDPSVIGAPFYVMDEVAGRVFRSPADVSGLSTQERGRLGMALVETLADLHDLEADAIGLGDLGRPDGYLERQIDRWARQYRQVRVRDLPQVESIAAALASRVPATGRAAIVHGDYRLDNVIVSPEDPGRIAAVLDWEMATRGDALADLATFLMFWDEPGRPHNPISGGQTALPGFPSRTEIVERYANRRGVVVDDLGWYVVFAQFRLAVILEQIHARHVAGRTRGEGFDSVGDMVLFLLDTCAQSLAEGV